MKQRLLHFVVLLITITLTFLNNAAYAQTKKVLVCGAASSTNWSEDVRLKIQGTGLFLQVDKFDVTSSTPSLSTLQSYDAVLVFSDGGFENGTAFGDNLADYIDAGGGVVSAVFNNASVPVGGKFNSQTYLVIVPENQTQNVRRTLGVIHLPSHPAIQGITAFDAGSSSYRTTSATLTPGSYRVADYDNGEFLIAAKDDVGPAHAKRVDLNFYPPSNSVRGDFWVATSDGAKLMANALMYVAGPSIVVSVSSVSLCTGTPLQLQYSAKGEYLSGNTFKAQLSDANGSFANPLEIGSISTTTTGIIDANLPSGITPGTGYRIRIVSDHPVVIGSDNGSDLNINPAPLAQINGTASICTGSELTLNATTIPGASYSWSGPNGFTAASQNISIDNVTVSNAGTYSLTVTSNGCSSVSATNVAINALPAIPEITSGSSTTFCAGGEVILSATSASAYQWYKDGSMISGATGQTYAAHATGNYTVEITNASGCKNLSAATSVTVNPLVTPSVVIGTSTATAILLNTSVTFTAASVNGGTPSYQWKKNGTDIIGANASTYTTTSLVNSDKIVCEMTSTATCATPATVASNEITITVLPPTITLNGALSNFNQIIGSVSATQTFNVSGINLVGDLTISAPTGYELSLNGSTWSTSVTLSPSANKVAVTPVSVRLNALTAATFTGNITIASTGTSQAISVSGIAAMPTLTVSGTINSLTQVIGSGSPAQTFIVGGINLLGIITVTAPSGYELSANGSSWNNSVTFSPANNTVDASTVSIRLNATTANNYAGDITITSPGAASSSIPVSGVALPTPVLTLSGAAMDFTQNFGTPSFNRSYQISGSNLLDKVSLTAPTGFELSLDGKLWYSNSNPLVLPHVDGNLANTTVFVRLNSQEAKSYSGIINHETQYGASVNLAVSGINYMVLKVSPNPVPVGTNQIIVWHPQLYTVATLTVYNLNGVKMASYYSQPRTTSTAINVQYLPTGVYLIEFRRLDVKQVFKFIKQ
jgi:hypothetical protein